MSVRGTPLVSAVICVVDPHPTYFSRAVDSVLNQTVCDLELIVVEESSARSAIEALAAFHDPRIRHDLHPTRTHLVHQRNRALRLAKSDLVMLMDADDICEPDRLEKQLTYLEAHPEVDVLGSRLTIIDPDDRVLGYRPHPLTHEQIVAAMPRFNPIAQPSVLYRRHAAMKAGGYQYGRNPAVEDYELWARMIRCGYRFANHPEPLLRYRVHPDGAKTAKLRSILRGTVEVKRWYWREQMGLADYGRQWAERAMLFLPPRWVLKAFLRTQVKPSLTP